MSPSKKSVRLVAAEQGETPVAENTPVAAPEETAVPRAQPSTVAGPRLRITLVKSVTGFKYDQKRTLAALGLRRLHMTVERPDNPSIRGMVAKVEHLVRVEEIR